jgi:L-iditol 2-dehydrogenase
MRVAVYYNNRDVRLEQRPTPTIGPGEILLKIVASGICGSDVMEWYRVPKAPVVLGHEVAGEVVAVGHGVTRFQPGDRVVTTHHVPCGSCRYCQSDRHAVCDTLRTTQFDPGGFAEYVRLPAINVERGTFRLPDHVSFEAGSFVEPLACVVRAQRVARFAAGQSVLVLGSGLAGLLHIPLARARGAGRILATDVAPSRLDAARRFGADAAITASDALPTRIREENTDRLADQVWVSTGARSAIGQAFASVDRGGTILFFAPAAPGATYPVPMHDIWHDGITIVHSYAGPPADMRSALDLIAEGRVDVGAMITHRLGLAQTGEGFRLTAEAANSLKVIVEPQR